MGVTNFIDVFVGGELQRPSFSQVKTQVECVATNLKENKNKMLPWHRIGDVACVCVHLLMFLKASSV